MLQYVTLAVLLSLMVGLQPSVAQSEAPQRPYVGVMGFGADSVGGSGRHLAVPRSAIYRVTNLADKGPGSLRACVEGVEPRVCVFDVSGAIRLDRALRIRHPYLTVAGQTAPADGIELRGAGVLVSSHDVVLQHLEIRVGDEAGNADPESRDGVAVVGKDAYRVILDHLSVSWAVDENLSTGGGAHDITISNCLVSEGLERSIHPKGAHSKGVLFGDGTKRVSMYGSVLAHNVDRNPYFKPGVIAEFVNNVVYNWSGESRFNAANLSDYEAKGEATLVNFIGNTYIAGPDSPRYAIMSAKNPAPGTRVYVKGNMAPLREKGKGSEWDIAEIPAMPHRSMEPVMPIRVEAKDASEAFEEILLRAGSRPAMRGPVDRRIIEEIRERRGGVKDCLTGCDRSVGIRPERPLRVDPFVLPATPFADQDRDGYTDLEEWLALEPGAHRSK